MTTGICNTWKLSGKCDNFDCGYKHPEICSQYRQDGTCLDRYMNFFHPTACRKMICFGENCEFFHPIKPKKNVCKNWKIMEHVHIKIKCRFFHPIICEVENCKKIECNLFHIGGHNVTPMRTKIMTFAHKIRIRN